MRLRRHVCRSAFLAACVPSAMVSLFGFSCTSTVSREHENNQHFIKKIAISNLQMRRPPVLGADPKAGPGGVDYHRTPLPDAKLDCAPLQLLFESIDLSALRTCIAENHGRRQVSYILKRDVMPSFELADLGKPLGAPPQSKASSVPSLDPNQGMIPDVIREADGFDCLKDVLPVIPLPREIVFQSDEEGQMRCYSSRLDIEADELFYVKVPKAKVALKIDFPVPKMPANNAEMRLMLLSWVLAPFRNPSIGDKIEASLMPDPICRRCMGEKNMFTPQMPPPYEWPSDGPQQPQE